MSTTRQVLRWPVPVDDQAHPVGDGPVKFIASRPDPTRPAGTPCGLVEIWTEENSIVGVTRLVQVFGTGHLIPEGAVHLGSTFDGGTPALVWHLYQLGGGS